MISLVMRILSRKCTGTVMIMQEVLKVSNLSEYNTVKKFLGTRLIMNSMRLCNSHQRHKFLRAEVPRNSLKFRVLELAFSEVFKRYTVFCTMDAMLFPIIRIQARLGTMPSKCPRRSTREIAWFKRFIDLNLLK